MKERKTMSDWMRSLGGNVADWMATGGGGRSFSPKESARRQAYQDGLNNKLPGGGTPEQIATRERVGPVYGPAYTVGVYDGEVNRGAYTSNPGAEEYAAGMKLGREAMGLPEPQKFEGFGGGEASVSQGSGGTYRVQGGDQLGKLTGGDYALARQIAEYNNLEDWNMIKAGQDLRLKKEWLSPSSKLLNNTLGNIRYLG